MTSVPFEDQLEQDLQVFAAKSEQTREGDEIPLLKLNFYDCIIQLEDVELLEDELDAITRPYTYRHEIPVDLSLADCQMASPAVLGDLEVVCVKYQVQRLNFSETRLNFYEQLRLVSTCSPLGLTSLRLSLRYQPGVVAPLLELCNEHLLELTLDARAPFEHRVRQVAMVELAPALVSLKKLQRFSLVDCELEDEVFAVLTGGLLALKDTLQHVQLQTEGGSCRGLTWESLPLLSHYMTELSVLETLLLDIKDCKRLMGGAPLEILKGFVQAIHNCQPGLDWTMEWHNVGWTQESAAKVLGALSRNNNARRLSVDIQDFDFLQDPHDFAKTMAAALPEMQNVAKLSVADMHSSSSSLDFQNDGIRTLLLDSLQQNTALEVFSFQVGPLNLLCEDDEEIGSILRRNAAKDVHETKSTEQEDDVEDDDQETHDDQDDQETKLCEQLSLSEDVGDSLETLDEQYGQEPKSCEQPPLPDDIEDNQEAPVDEKDVHETKSCEELSWTDDSDNDVGSPDAVRWAAQQETQLKPPAIDVI